MTTIGSLFSGVGGLDLAVEAVTGGRTVWQVEQAPAARRVLARHWPDADRSVADVREARGMRGVDVLCGGFPCQDLSVAGSWAGLSGERSGLFYELSRVVAECQPSLVVLENVPGVAAFRSEIEAALPGYGFRWVKWSATTAGAPHLRRRVLIVATRGGRSLPDLDLAVSSKVTAAGAPDALWASPLASLGRRSGGRRGDRPVTHACLAEQARTWPTPCATDYKGRTIGGTGRLADALDETGAVHRLNPDWVETLMGWPVGWTLPDGPSMREAAEELLSAPRWPRGRPPADWSGPWPGYEWEPDRTETGPPVRGRPARLKACGNGVVPQAAIMALRAALKPPRQLSLLEAR